MITAWIISMTWGTQTAASHATAIRLVQSQPSVMPVASALAKPVYLERSVTAVATVSTTFNQVAAQPVTVTQMDQFHSSVTAVVNAPVALE